MLKSAASEFEAFEVQNVEYCELMQKPEDYIGKLIRVEAVYKSLATLESILYSECEPKVSAVSVALAAGKFNILSEESLSKLNVKTINNAKIIVVGKFFGPRKPNSKFNYGHYGWSKYKFEIHSLEKAESMPEKK